MAAATGGDDDLAAQLWGAAARVREQSGFARVPADATLLEREMHPVRERLGAGPWSAAYDAGGRLDLEGVVATTGALLAPRASEAAPGGVPAG